MFACFDDRRIWGAGETADDALLDAEHRADAPQDLLTAEMTPGLASTVKAWGVENQQIYRLQDGRLGTVEEWASQGDEADEDER